MTRTHASVEGFFVGMAEQWLLLHNRARTMPHGRPADLSDPTATAWRATQVADVHLFTVLYLLALLREVRPDVAERAVTILADDTALTRALAGRHPEDVISDWQLAMATGRPVRVPLGP